MAISASTSNIYLIYKRLKGERVPSIHNNYILIDHLKARYRRAHSETSQMRMGESSHDKTTDSSFRA